MLDLPPAQLIPRGNPGDPKVVLYSQAYAILLRLTRITMPSATIAALLGRVEQSKYHTIVTVEDAYPLRLPQNKRGAILDQDATKPATAQKSAGKQHVTEVVGWCYIDSGEPGPRSEVDIVSIQRALLAEAPEALLVLLANLATDEGAFYIWRGDRFESTGGLYELLPNSHALPVVPWSGRITLPEGLVRADVLAPPAAEPEVTAEQIAASGQSEQAEDTGPTAAIRRSTRRAIHRIRRSHGTHRK